MDTTYLGPVTGSLAFAIEVVMGTRFEPAAHALYEIMVFFGERGL